jgi:hypothetical protein
MHQTNNCSQLLTGWTTNSSSATQAPSTHRSLGSDPTRKAQVLRRCPRNGLSTVAKEQPGRRLLPCQTGRAGPA